ncbi:PAS domain S-box protein [Mucilaginibacter conchicola]|uniref:histidine kinase n=1 Tax=Mucilaginibacter conchicola TaxID=2303333 RepID=A0A372NT67_9SPHI|nr:ATP-binding protein [Mucilaginibacter conchicola]RFZ92312.1 PAS domain S-box protein [Mucilaginibacter conchicola]
MDQSLLINQLRAEIANLQQNLALSTQELGNTKAELQESSYRLEEANDMIEAIRSGELDALVFKNNDKHEVYTLSSSDQAYRIFIEQMTAGAVTLNRNGAILYSNSRFATLMGLPLEQVTGKPFCNFSAPQHAGYCRNMIEKAWLEGAKHEFVLITADQREVPVLLSMQTLDLVEGLSMSIIITDLSEQKHHQQLLEEKNAALEDAQRKADELNNNLEQTVRERTIELYSNQERLGRILETMAEGVGITDINGQLTYANPMAQKILGLTHEEIKERTFYDTQWRNLKLDGSPLPAEEHPMAVMMRTEQPLYDQEIAVQPPQGERFYISINAAPIRDEDGKLVGGIGTFMDVTHRRRAIQQKDEFISVASHELRTPITSLKASLQLLDRMKEKPNAAMLPKLISQSNKSLNKVSVLIDDLLNATKMTEGQLALNKSDFLLAALIEDSCQHIRAEGEFTIRATGDESLMVNADMFKIEQVLVNLVNNAVKYAPDSKTIQIQFIKEGQTAKVSVTDTGPGIPQEKFVHLFERYYRVSSLGHQYSGLGLGLYISSEIIKKHGGEIGVESQLGKGATFWFTIPL